MQINFETFSEYYSQSLINVESCIFNIPHSSIVSPNSIDDIQDIILDKTDWMVDKIFEIYGATTIKAEFSRIFCDVDITTPLKFERSDFDNRFWKEDLFNSTLDLDGKQIQTPDNFNFIHEKFYKEYYKKFNKLIDDKLNKIINAYIINCHTFPSDRLSEEAPDICLGTDDFHTPLNLINKIKNHFSGYGLLVKINEPYSGTITPEKFYKKDPRVKSIRIEINRKLYMDEKTKQVNLEKVVWLNQMINKLF